MLNVQKSDAVIKNINNKNYTSECVHVQRCVVEQFVI